MRSKVADRIREKTCPLTREYIKVFWDYHVSIMKIYAMLEKAKKPQLLLKSGENYKQNEQINSTTSINR